MSNYRIKVLFICTGNSCRSQIAEAFLREKGACCFEAYSAGTDPKPIHPLTIEVMKEKGIDMSGHRSKDIKEFLGKLELDYAVVVCDKAGQTCPRIWPGLKNHPLHWSFEDPASVAGSDEAKLQKFREVRDLIERKINMFVEVLGERSCCWR